jgi:thiol peroxidase
MAHITLQGKPVDTAGSLPAKGSVAPQFTLVKSDLADVNLSSFLGKTVVLNIFPSIDTPVCALSVRRFNAEADAHENTVVICISADLPFAHGRFCGAEGLDKVVSASTFRDHDFGKDYGIIMVNGPLRGLLARAVVIIDEDGTIKYTELVKDISMEPDYDAAIKALG